MLVRVLLYLSLSPPGRAPCEATLHRQMLFGGGGTTDNERGVFLVPRRRQSGRPCGCFFVIAPIFHEFLVLPFQ
jgi:hypothetical protein